MTTECMQRHVPYINWSSTQHTLYTLMSEFTRLMGLFHWCYSARLGSTGFLPFSSREITLYLALFFCTCSIEVRYLSYVWIQLGTIIAFRKVLIYLGWACSIEVLTIAECQRDREIPIFWHLKTQFRSGHNGSAVVTKRTEENSVRCNFPTFHPHSSLLTLPFFFVLESFICVIHLGLFKVKSILLFSQYWTWNPN